MSSSRFASLGNGTDELVSILLGAAAEAEALKCKLEWDALDSRVLLAASHGEDGEDDTSGLLRYSLHKARTCDQSKIAALIYGITGERKADYSRRLAAAKLKKHSVQNDMTGDDGGCGEVVVGQLTSPNSTQ